MLMQNWQVISRLAKQSRTMPVDLVTLGAISATEYVSVRDQTNALQNTGYKHFFQKEGNRHVTREYRDYLSSV